MHVKVHNIDHKLEVEDIFPVELKDECKTEKNLIVKKDNTYYYATVLQVNETSFKVIFLDRKQSIEEYFFKNIPRRTVFYKILTKKEIS